MFSILPYSASGSKPLICKQCRTLQSTKTKVDRYFHAVIHEDIDCIADNLRILHSENKKDTQVVLDDTGGLSILIERIQRLKDFKGTPQEIKLKLFTLILGTDINRLNKQEKAVMQTLFKKGEYCLLIPYYHLKRF